MSKKHIIVFVFISILLVGSLVLSGALFYQKQQDKLWVVAINEDGVYIEGENTYLLNIATSMKKIRPIFFQHLKA